MSSGIPIAICGRGEKIPAELCNRLAPDYDGDQTPHGYRLDVVLLADINPHPSRTPLPHASCRPRRDPAVLRGDLVAPSSNIGTNAKRAPDERVAPKMLFLGGGITTEEMNELKEKAGEDAGNVKWVKARMEMVMELGGLSINNVETVTKRMLKEAVVEA